MVFQKGHPRPPLKQKACLICGKSFQPASGAQMSCSDKCKVEARSKGLNKRGPRMQSKDHEGETREERMTRIDRGNPIPSLRGQRVQEGRAFPPARHDIPKRMLPGPAVGNGSPASNVTSANSLELDLSPLESFIRQEIQMALDEVAKRSDQGVSASANEEIMREIIRQIVREEISERLRNLI